MQPTVQIRTPFFILTIAMAVVIGFLAGYIYTNQMNWNTQRTVAATSPAAPSDANLPPALPESAATGQLPQGHPPINPDPTIAAMQKDVEADPTNAQKTVDLANFLYDNQRYSDAIQWYLKALKLNPKNPDVETDLGTAYYYTGDADSALKHFNIALREDPRHIQTIHNKFIVLLEAKKDIPGARAALQQMESIDPQNSSLPGLRDMLRQAQKGS